MKLDFQRFDGDDPTTWVYQVKQYFSLNQILDDQKVNLNSFHLEHEVVQWYQWAQKVHGTPSWGDFTKYLLIRFDLSDFEDFIDALTKLQQTTIVREYQTKFEKLANCIEGIDDAFYRSYFISGLKANIQVEVKMFKLEIIMAAVGLAKFVEDKASAQCQHTKHLA